MTDLVLNGRVNWSGEHWISYLRPPGASADTGMVSLYNMRYTEAGHGFVAFVVIDDGGGPPSRACARTTGSWPPSSASRSSRAPATRPTTKSCR